MSTFQLTIVTPDGEYYHGPAESLTVRATTGELTLLAHHIDFVTALGMGEARVTIDGQKRYAACIGGMLAMTKNEVRLIATTFEWADQIDLPRAKGCAGPRRVRAGKHVSFQRGAARPRGGEAPRAGAYLCCGKS